jgi:hypothetical protein
VASLDPVALGDATIGEQSHSDSGLLLAGIHYLKAVLSDRSTFTPVAINLGSSEDVGGELLNLERFCSSIAPILDPFSSGVHNSHEKEACPFPVHATKHEHVVVELESSLVRVYS